MIRDYVKSEYQSMVKQKQDLEKSLGTYTPGSAVTITYGGKIKGKKGKSKGQKSKGDDKEIKFEGNDFLVKLGFPIEVIDPESLQF